jgi:hypothetical protein
VAEVGDRSIALFELPVEVWSVAAQLAGRTRDEFAEQIERSVDAYVATPAGRDGLTLRMRTTRSTLQPVTLADLADVPEGLRGIRLIPVLAPSQPFEEPVPAEAPPRALFRPQPPVAVRNMSDLLLQDREFTCGQARALVAMLSGLRQRVGAKRLVHADDPLGEDRLRPGALLPTSAVAAPDDQSLTQVDFFQAWTLCRLLGVAVGDDPRLFRLPLGCELELAAYGAAKVPSCHGAGAAGGEVSMRDFVRAARDGEAGETTRAVSRASGDFVPTDFGFEFVGLDFGVREWVGDLPHVPRAQLLLSEWTGDCAVHLDRVSTFGSGDGQPPPDLVAPLRTFGVVRGLARGELDGLVDMNGARLEPESSTCVPLSVPGVLRTEQLRRDGRDLLTSVRDPRLARVGFRVAGTASTVARLRGRR